MEKHIKVSIIIPVYNGEVFIARALDSALAQTLKAFEVIVVDDGSSDGTRAIVEQYGQRVKYLYQSNKGPAAARNLGMKNARGEYIAFLDADDIWLPKKLEKQIALLEAKPDIGFVYCDNHFVDDAGKTIPNYVRKVKLMRGDILLDFFKEFFVMTPALVFRKSLQEKIGFFNEKLMVGEDFDYILRLAAASQADYVDQKLWNRVVRQKSLSRQDYILDKTNDLETMLRFIQEHPDFYATHRGAVKKHIADCYFHFGYRAMTEGKQDLAFRNLFCSLKYTISLKALKALVKCLLMQVGLFPGQGVKHA